MITPKISPTITPIIKNILIFWKCNKVIHFGNKFIKLLVNLLDSKVIAGALTAKPIHLGICTCCENNTRDVEHLFKKDSELPQTNEKYPSFRGSLLLIC